MTGRMVVLPIEVNEVDRSSELYRRAFGIDLRLDDHEGGAAGAGDRWTSGRHAAVSWSGAGTCTSPSNDRTRKAARHVASKSASSSTTWLAPTRQPWPAVPKSSTDHEFKATGVRPPARDLDGNVVSLTEPREQPEYAGGAPAPDVLQRATLRPPSRRNPGVHAHGQATVGAARPNAEHPFRPSRQGLRRGADSRVVECET